MCLRESTFINSTFTINVRQCLFLPRAHTALSFCQTHPLQVWDSTVKAKKKHHAPPHPPTFWQPNQGYCAATRFPAQMVAADRRMVVQRPRHRLDKASRLAGEKPPNKRAKLQGLGEWQGKQIRKDRMPIWWATKDWAVFKGIRFVTIPGWASFSHRGWVGL